MSAVGISNYDTVMQSTHSPKNSDSTRRVLILGSSGHLGKLILRACQSRSDLQVQGASRSGRNGSLAIDLERDYTELRHYDVIINATDSSKVSPTEIARFCLEHGKIFLETSARVDVVRDLIRLSEDSNNGTIVLGAGAFPGLSTHLLEFAEPKQPLEFRLGWSVFSAAGLGTIDLMIEAFNSPTEQFKDSSYRKSDPLTPIVRRSFDNSEQTFVTLSMADVAIAAEKGDYPSVTFLANIRPTLPQFMLRILAWKAKRGWFSPRLVQRGLRIWLSLLRRVVFGNRPTPLRIELHSDNRMLAAISCEDGFACGASAAAILAARWPAQVKGLKLPHEGVPFEQLAAELVSAQSLQFE